MAACRCHPTSNVPQALRTASVTRASSRANPARWRRRQRACIFDTALVQRIDALGVRRAQVTLHVGAGTFQPLRVDDVAHHVMHAERYTVPQSLVAAVSATRARGGRVVAVGTTVARALESAAASGTLAAGSGDTRLFITPGYAFRVVDALITNFHLPESTLLMLVSAFAGLGHVLAAYRHAVRARYRFFSYGDAMFITPSTAAVPARDATP